MAGGVEPKTAAWVRDALTLYVSAYALERALVPRDQEWVLSHDELIGRFSVLPADRFPNTRRYAAEPTSGTGHDRFDFTIDLVTANLAKG